MKRLLLLVLIISHFVLGAPGAAAQDTLPRTALVMGVGSYDGAKYKGRVIQDLPGITSADLPGMEDKLKSLGFQVTVVTNPTLSQAKQAVDAFSADIKARPGVSLFYFSGHGGEYEGKNYLIPRGADIASTADLSDEALSAQRVLNGMEESGAQVNLVFLDCCREDLGKNISGAEMAPLKARGSFIGFATRSGDFADPEQQGSPYTRFLLKHLDRPGISVSDMYGFVARDVGEYSKTMLGEERRPGFYSELAGEPFYFVPVKFTRSPTSPAMTEAEIERRARELAARMVPQTPSTTPSVEPPQPTPRPTTSGSILDQGTVGKVAQIKLSGEVVMNFAYCPQGSFMMGSPASEKDRNDDEDQVSVRITKGFWMGQTEVTQGQWKALMGNNPSDFKGDNLPTEKVNRENQDRTIAKLNQDLSLPSVWLYGLPTEAQNELPVENVNWEDAQTFIAKLNQSMPLPAGWIYALPTEAQWEYACRAGTESVFHFGEVLNASQANCNGNFPYGTITKGPYVEKTIVASRYTPNAWGLYDMHGNVWEWCADWYAEKLPGGTDPVGFTNGSYRVFRGGSWFDYARDCRASLRGRDSPVSQGNILGFRLAAVPVGAR